MAPSRRCPAPLRLALVWGAAAVLVGLVAVGLFLWTVWSTDSGLACAAPFDGAGAACRLYDAWLPVLELAGVLAFASVAALVVGVATRSCGGSRPRADRRG